MPVAMSLLQQLQLDFAAAPPYFSSVKFGGVVFKQNPCGVGDSLRSSALSSNYRDVVSFFERRTQDMGCNDYGIVQPVDDGLVSAAKMLSGAENETNIIVLIGTTAELSQAQSAINALTRVRARAIFFPTQSKSEDAYNDFVTVAEKAVIYSAENISELKKEKIVNQQDLLLNNSYSLTQGESGVYFLDFPQKSMTQGFVIFPNKGETMQASVLIHAVDTMLVQVTNDNKRTDSTLTAYFRSDIGVSNTTLLKPYQDILKYSGGQIPAPIASAMLNQNTPFLFAGYLSDKLNPLQSGGVKLGILLNEQEYGALQNYYMQISKKVLKSGDFSRGYALRKYVRLLSQKTLTTGKIGKGTIRGKSMRQVVALYTGYMDNDKNILMNYSLKQ
jgi:hypothetical protein